MADIYGDPDEPMVMPPTLYEPLQDERVTDAFWFRGVIDRPEAEALLTRKGLPGNFLVRQRKGTTDTFVHCYLSQSKQKVVHNLVVFRKGKEVLVDSRPFSATGLDDVVNKIQTRLKAWRKLVEQIPASVASQVANSWGAIYQPSLNKASTGQYLIKDPPGAFVVRMGVDGDTLLSVKRQMENPHDLYNGVIMSSKAGYYLKFSELIGEDMQSLVCLMLINPERALAAGMPAALKIPAGVAPQQQQRSPSVPSMTQRPLPTVPPSGGSDVNDLYGDPDDDGGDYGDIDDTVYGDADDAQPQATNNNPLDIDDIHYGDDNEQESDFDDTYEDIDRKRPNQSSNPRAVTSEEAYGKRDDIDAYEAESGEGIIVEEEYNVMPDVNDDAPPPLPPGRPNVLAPPGLRDEDNDDSEDDGPPPPIVPRGPAGGYNKPAPPPPPPGGDEDDDDDDAPPPLPPPISRGGGDDVPPRLPPRGF